MILRKPVSSKSFETITAQVTSFEPAINAGLRSGLNYCLDETLSDDLDRGIREFHGSTGVTIEETARRFMVGTASVKRILAALRKTASLARMPPNGGPPPKVLMRSSGSSVRSSSSTTTRPDRTFATAGSTGPASGCRWQRWGGCWSAPGLLYLGMLSLVLTVQVCLKTKTWQLNRTPMTQADPILNALSRPQQVRKSHRILEKIQPRSKSALSV